MKHTGFMTLKIAALLGTGLLSLPSQAENADRQDQASQLMEELVVTARRREEACRTLLSRFQPTPKKRWTIAA